MRFEINVYGPDDEIIKTHATDYVRFGAFEEAINFTEAVAGKSGFEVDTLAVKTFKKIAKQVFPAITDDEIRLCDIRDVVNLLYQVSGQISAPLATAAGEGEKN